MLLSLLANIPDMSPGLSIPFLTIRFAISRPKAKPIIPQLSDCRNLWAVLDARQSNEGSHLKEAFRALLTSAFIDCSLVRTASFGQSSYSALRCFTSGISTTNESAACLCDSALFSCLCDCPTHIRLQPINHRITTIGNDTSKTILFRLGMLIFCDYQ